MARREETAAEAYRRGVTEAANVAGDFCWRRSQNGGELKSPAVFTSHTHQHIREVIHAVCLDEESDQPLSAIGDSKEGQS